MSEKRIVVPEGMLKAIQEAWYTPTVLNDENHQRIILEAALRWLSGNFADGIVQRDLFDEAYAVAQTFHKDFPRDCAFRAAREYMKFFLTPKPDPDEPIKDLLCQPSDIFFGDVGDGINKAVREAYRRGKEGK